LLVAGVQHLPPWLVPLDSLEAERRESARQRETAEAAKAKVAEWMLTRADMVERVTLRRDQFEGGDDARRLAWSELDKVRQLLESWE
jgi:hypothetical protein